MFSDEALECKTNISDSIANFVQGRFLGKNHAKLIKHYFIFIGSSCIIVITEHRKRSQKERFIKKVLQLLQEPELVNVWLPTNDDSDDLAFNTNSFSILYNVRYNPLVKM